MREISAQTKALVALQCVEELSLKKKKEMLDAIPNPDLWLSSTNKDKVVRILGEEKASQFFENCNNIGSIVSGFDRDGISFVTCFDEKYPEQLREIYDFPLVLFAKGNIALLNSDCISVVGTRSPTRYGMKVCGDFTREFVRADFTIVSGFARGIDSTAHRACIDADGKTIAVFACGINRCYPAENKELYDAILSQGGLLISEYPVDTPPLQYHFPERNRIISGLSRGVFVPEATLKSGSIITAKLAVEQGKELFVVPGNINSPESEGSNRLLQEIPGAIVIDAQDVFDRLGVKINAKVETFVELTMAETLVTEALHDKELHFEELLDATGLDASELNEVLINLEINGVIDQTTGNYYSLA